MKYQQLPVSFDITEREKYNNHIIAAIRNKRAKQFTEEEIYNYFTGKGQLHNLSYEDYNNYAAYAAAKKEIEKGQFFTPHDLCNKIITALQPEPRFLIADITCGKGSFFNFLPNESNCYGCEIDQDSYRVAKRLFPTASLKNGDFIYYTTGEKMDLVIGNPPFNLATSIGISQWAYLQKAAEIIKYSGIVVVIVPASFLSDEFQDKTKIEWLNNTFHFVCQSHLPSGSFNAAIETKLLILQKKALHTKPVAYRPGSFTPFDPKTIYTEYIAPIYAFNKQNAARLHLFTIQQSVGNKEYTYLINKALWHIKSNPALHKSFYKKALVKLEEINTLKQPANMPDAEWIKQRPTPEKVYRWMKSILQHQNDPKLQKQLKVVKTNYGLKCKAYHPTLKSFEWKKSVHELLSTGERHQGFTRLYDRKEKTLAMQEKRFVEMEHDSKVDTFLHRFRLRPKWQNTLHFKNIQPKTIALNALQKTDLGLLLQKRYAILAWEQGGGKSIAGLTWLSYWKEHYKVAFLLAPSLAVNTTWKQRLSVYGFDFIRIRGFSDVEKIQPGQIAVVTYEKLIDLQYHIKKYVKHQAYKIALLVDESDELTNDNSLRCRAALNCFRKAKLKLLTTGTTTRNTINELYPQLELVYNNSTAFSCHASLIYKVNKSGELVECMNELQGLPFPAYHGKALFKAAFCPHRVTVFGINQDTQNIYNSALLKDIIAKTIITRKFEEIVGDKKFSLHTHTVTQTEAEKKLYRILMQQFLEVIYHYFTSTGNARKEAGLRLIRQIRALITATSTPHLMIDYPSNSLPAKFGEIARLIHQWPNELVTVGAIFKKTARAYKAFLQQEFPARQIFYIDGDVPVTERQNILDDFYLSKNGILVCTQQSLKSSVDIPYCNKCIIESLQWNIPKMAQFYFRFIRFSSTRHTEVHFVNYSDTIEINLLALLISKEKLNDFVKTTNEKSSEDIFQQFNIDPGILESLIETAVDTDGRLQLRWGKQVLN